VPGLKRYTLQGDRLPEFAESEIALGLHDGALVIYPTDTLYAIGCRALHGEAVTRLRRAKGRDASKALPVIVSDLAQARSIAARWPEGADRLAALFWPGPLTLVVPAARALPGELLAGASGVAVRVPASGVARALARLGGPLVATSANRAGETPCTSVDLAALAFPLATLAFGPLDGPPSTLVDLTGPEGDVKVLREGRVAAASIFEALAAS
jgi:L-threonylcarbamoyladenylate synthase